MSLRRGARALAAFGLGLALATQPAAAETIRLEKHAGGGYLIPGRINDAVTVRFVLDTGASDVLIPEDVATALQRAGKLEPGDFIGTRTYVLADGSKVPSKRVLLRELTVGGQTVSNVTASIGRRGSPPLLGQSFLSKFPSWTLDNERHVLVLASKGRAGGAAFGAFAHDGATGRYGASWNQESPVRADETALKGCASDTCEIVFRTAARQCGAIATTGTGKIWGGATRAERGAAERAALANCDKRTADTCKLRSVQCNR